MVHDPPGPGQYRFQEGDFVRVLSLSRSSVTLIAEVWVLYDDGGEDKFEVEHSPNTDRTTAAENAERSFERRGVVIAVSGSVSKIEWGGGASVVKRGESFFTIYVASRGDILKHRLARGYVYDGGSLALGDSEELLDGAGLKVDNEAASTLVNNTALTRTITVPTNARWKFEGGYAFNGDDVNRVTTVRLNDGSNILHPLSEGQTVVAATNLTFPNPVGDRLHGRGVPMTLTEADRVTIAWSAGGASAGGTARSSAVVQEWIEI